MKDLIRRILKEETFNDLFQVKDTWVELSKEERNQLKHKIRDWHV